MFGIDLNRFLRSLQGLPFYISDYLKLRKAITKESSFKFGPFFPILHERFLQAGTMSGAYFHQDLFVAREILHNNPVRHIDIGSRIDGFVAHVAVFREIEVIDIRTQASKVKNILFRRADLMQLPSELLSSCDSISSLHAIEHFGLGRYGDPIDYDGHLKAIRNISLMLKNGGKFYFSVPIGPQRIEFNANRIFSVRYLLETFKNDFELDQFCFIDDKGDFFENAELTKANIDNNFGCKHGCGVFVLTKK